MEMQPWQPGRSSRSHAHAAGRNEMAHVAEDTKLGRLCAILYVSAVMSGQRSKFTAASQRVTGVIDAPAGLSWPQFLLRSWQRITHVFSNNKAEERVPGKAL